MDIPIFLKYLIKCRSIVVICRAQLFAKLDSYIKEFNTNGKHSHLWSSNISLYFLQRLICLILMYKMLWSMHSNCQSIRRTFVLHYYCWFLWNMTKRDHNHKSTSYHRLSFSFVLGCNVDVTKHTYVPINGHKFQT